MNPRAPLVGGLTRERESGLFGGSDFCSTHRRVGLLQKLALGEVGTWNAEDARRATIGAMGQSCHIRRVPTVYKGRPLHLTPVTCVSPPPRRT